MNVFGAAHFLLFSFQRSSHRMVNGIRFLPVPHYAPVCIVYSCAFNHWHCVECSNVHFCCCSLHALDSYDFFHLVYSFLSTVHLSRATLIERRKYPRAYKDSPNNSLFLPIFSLHSKYATVRGNYAKGRGSSILWHFL